MTASVFGDELDEVLRGANPNPTRQGCPPNDVLVALSRRERPMEDSAYEHLLECSPCYVEVRDMQRAHVVATHDRPSRRWWLVAAAAAVLVAAVGVWWLAAGRGATAPGATETPATMQVTLDLRPYAVTRSPTETEEPPPLELPRGPVELTILLPVGSEPGLYDVQVLDSERRAIASIRGEATIREFVTSLPVTLGLGGVAPGRCSLAVRRLGDDWRVYPAVVNQRP